MDTNDLHISEALLIKYYRGHCAESEKNNVEHWLSLSAQNKTYYQNLVTIWNASSQKQNHSIKPEASWERIEKKIQAPRKIRKINRQLLAIAASVCMLVSLAWFFYTNNTADTSQLSIIENTSDTVHSYILPDKSTIWLSKNARIEFPKQFDKNRKILLIGEAYFSVTKDSLHPFTISNNNSMIKVLGTEFNVKPSENKLTVSVIRGKVSLKNIHSNQQTILTKGYKGVSNSNGLVHKSKDVNPNAYAWKTGKLFFDNQSLISACSQLEKIYNVNIIFSDNSFDKELITASFENQSIEEIMSIFSLTLDLNYTKKDTVYTIAKRIKK